MVKRTARNANSGYSAIASCTWTNVTPQIAVTPTRARRGPGRRTERILYALPAMGVVDTLGRPVRDLRISVTDRCSFRCVYCMPREVFGHETSFLHRRVLFHYAAICLG